MKKVLSFILLLVVILGLVACGNENSANCKGTKESDYVTIDSSNYNFYFSIDDSYITSSSVASSVGMLTSITRKITISGAVNGIYSDCLIVFEYGKDKTQQTLKLNAAGFASFEYTINSSTYIAKIVSCSGKLYL